MTAQYQFLPWVRQGAARAFKNPDLLGPQLLRNDGKPLGLLPVGLKINSLPGPEVGVRVYGPGDVTGIDPRVILRVDPPRRSADFEPNYLVSIEFDPPDFPWLFTPAAAGEQGRLRPWLVLVVVEPGENAHLEVIPRQPLPVLVAAVSELPDLIESWAWAHAQAIQPDAGQPVGQILTSLPNQNLSRLICPRRLKPDTHYLACLVPATAAGRIAGLGQTPTQADMDVLAPAWEAGQGEVRLPAYDHWEFSTGIEGDFESMARRLQGRLPPAGIGRRAMQVDHQPFGLPDLGETILEGALVAADTGPLVAADAAFQNALREIINLSATQPVVTPPIYGHYQAALADVPDEGLVPFWFRELNLDPAHRAPAGLGTRVIQEHQDQLVASAWDQLGDGPGAKNMERRLEVAVAVLESVVRQRVATQETGQLVQFLGPAHSRLRASSGTLSASLASQGLPASFSSASFRRATRPAGSLSRKVVFSTPLNTPVTAARLAQEVPLVDPPAGTTGLLTGNLVQAVQITGSLNLPQTRYKEAITALKSYFIRFTGVKPLPAIRPAIFTAEFDAGLKASLNPAQSAPARFYARVSVAGKPVTPPAQPGQSVVQGVEFPQPMYEALRDLSAELLLPGVGKIDPDTVTLLKSNSRFIEAYMAGLNHEMAAELLWREFPGDLRQTYFRTFWDTRGSLEFSDQLPAMHTWAPTSHLGDNFGMGEAQLVLLIRGQLLQRYPHTLIYAMQAKDTRSLGQLEKYPLFRGRIEPDITFLGFDLTAEEARGDALLPGWFFVIQEQPGAPRFGMDDVRTTDLVTWNDLGWSDLKTQIGNHLALADLAVDAPPPGPVWAFNAAHMAAILRQRPVRVALHARHLLPPAQANPPDPGVPA